MTMDFLTRDLEYWNRVADDYDRSLVSRNTAEEASVFYEEFEFVFLIRSVILNPKRED